MALSKTKNSRLDAVFLAVGLTFPPSCLAAVINVYPDGSGDAPTIAAAYAMAVEYDDIVLHPGTYYEHDLVMKNRVDLISASDNPSDTIVDAQGLGRCLLGTAVLNVPTLTRGITFQNGFHAVEAGILLIQSNQYLVRYENCIFQGGQAPKGGAVGSFVGSAGHPDFVDCLFEGNSAVDGGAMWIRDVHTNSCIFRNNSATSRGGAVFVETGHLIADEGCIFEGNTAIGDGGAIYSTGAPNRTQSLLYFCSFIGNSAANGGAARLGKSDTMDRCIFLDNFATGEGGALFLQGMEDEDNVYVWLGGLFARNRAGTRGGAVSMQGWIVWKLSTFVSNEAPTGGHFWSAGSPTPRIENCILAFATNGGSIAGGGTATIKCSDVFGNTGGDFVGPIADGLNVPTNFSADPLFCDPQHSEWTLHEGSPCLLIPGCSPAVAGFYDQGCGPVSVKSTSWAQIKGLYRE